MRNSRSYPPIRFILTLFREGKTAADGKEKGNESVEDGELTDVRHENEIKTSDSDKPTNSENAQVALCTKTQLCRGCCH